MALSPFSFSSESTGPWQEGGFNVFFSSLWPVLAGTVQAVPQPQQQRSLFVSLKLHEKGRQ